MGAAMVFPRDAEIYRESSPATYLYKVISGTVRTLKTMSNGRRHIRTFYLPGDIFGVETGLEHAFSAEAITDAKLFVIERKHFNSLNRDSPLEQVGIAVSTIPGQTPARGD
jgi:CRP/FNR family nitrogen fixation transcriptional regulator